MDSFKTPGVYTQEIATLPPSVAEVSTAVPAFLGYTEKAPPGGIARITTLLEFQSLFGGPQPSEFLVRAGTDPRPARSRCRSRRGRPASRARPSCSTTA